jgi:S-formylglutathione hydrolase FrmB
VAGGRPAPVAADASHRYVLAAGTLEPFRDTTVRWRDALNATGRHTVTHHERVNGHDWLFWAEELPSAIATIGVHAS